jgi:hypothetical protein
VISVTERTATIARIRNVARQVAEAWLAERRSLGFPLLSEEKRSAWFAAHPEDAPASAEPSAPPASPALA